MQEITIELEIDRTPIEGNTQIENVRYVGLVGNVRRLIAHCHHKIGYSIPIGEVWYYTVVDNEDYVVLVGRKELHLSNLLIFKSNEEQCEFDSLKQHCLFYMRWKKSHAIFVKVSDSKAILLEDNHRNDGFIVSPETKVYPYYLQGLSQAQRDAISNILTNYFMTE